MSTAVSAPLTAEPSPPQERADHNLPPKSYAEATANGSDGTAGGMAFQANGAASLNDVNGSTKVNELKQNIDDGRVLYNKHISHNGEKLTSIKPDETYGDGRKHDAKLTTKARERTRNKEDADNGKLASGRRAGAGWERSALVLRFRSILHMLTSTASVGHLLMFHFNDDSRH